MTPFGAHIRSIREERGISQKQMAEDLHISAAYLSAMEHGRRGKPSPGLVMQICGYLGIIWDDVEEVKALALLSHPKVTLDTSGLSADRTELANRLAKRIRNLPDSVVEAMLALLR